MNTSDTIAAPPFPAKVAAAISQVMKAVPKLGKDEKNQHGGYQFASIDVFLQVVGRLCADAGLFIVQDEESFEIVQGTDKNGKPQPWLRVSYRFTLAHSSGEAWDHRPVRSIMVLASMGPQAFGSAQSYALKQFERSLFQIATGDGEDADHHTQSNLPGTRGGKQAPRQQPPKQDAHPDDLGTTDYKAALKAFEVERIGVLQALRGGEMTAEDANDRYREIRGGLIKFSVNGKDKTVKTEALLKQCMRDTLWHDNEKDGWQGFERRLKDTREELDRAIAKAGDPMPDDPFAPDHTEAAE